MKNANENANVTVNANDKKISVSKKQQAESLLKSKESLWLETERTLLSCGISQDIIDLKKVEFFASLEKTASDIASQATIRQANGSLSKSGFIADCLSIVDGSLTVDKNKVCELFNSHLESKGLPIQEKSTGKIDQNMGKVFTKILSDLVSENVITIDNLKLRLKKIGDENITAISDKE